MFNFFPLQSIANPISSLPLNDDRSYAQYNPVNALRRAKDFELAGDKTKAREQLYEVIVSKKMGRQWQPAHEALMLKFIDLCVEFREARKCKEGLYFYRQLTTLQNPQSLEKVVSYLVESSMKKAHEARARTESASLDSLEDLESEEQSPESLLMAGVSSESSTDRAEREILVPWVRHMWDTFRNVLEQLRNNVPLENLYHGVAIRAMGFCKQFNRGAEFRKLCNILRVHWSSLKINSETQDRPITTETVEKHLATRFVQLEHCAEMALWTEGYRTIGDIREIMEDMNVVPKNQLMASYYEKLARIFWVSENYLFHAYSWHRFVVLSLTKNTSLSEDDRKNLATSALLAAVSIPIYSSGTAGGVFGGGSSNTGANSDPLNVDPDRKKKSDLAQLLRTPLQLAAAAQGGVMPQVTLPTREALLAELATAMVGNFPTVGQVSGSSVSAGRRLLSLVKPEAAALFRLLEVDFSPLTLVQRALPLLSWVGSQTNPTLPTQSQGSGTAPAPGALVSQSLSQYLPNLQRLLVFRLLEHLTQVYSTVLIPNFQNLISGLNVSFFDVEKIAVRAVRLRQLAVRIDHRAGIIKLGTESTEKDSMRRRLTTLASRLQVVAEAIAPAPEETSVVPRDRRDQVFDYARIFSEDHRKEIMRRKDHVQRRKEEKEKAIYKQHQDDLLQKAIKDQEFKAQEEARLKSEEDARKLAAVQAINKKLEDDKLLALMTAAQGATSDGKSSGNKKQDLDLLKKMAKDHLDQAALQRAVQEKVLKAKEEETKRRVDQARRVEYLVRALREAEKPKLDAMISSTMEDDALYVTQFHANNLERKRAIYEAAMKVKSRIAKMVAHADAFEEAVLIKRREAYEKVKKVREDNERYNYLKQKLENARRRKAEHEALAIEEQNRKRAAEEDERKRAIEEEKRLKLEAKTRELEEEADEKRAAVLGANAAARLSTASGSDPTYGIKFQGPPKIVAASGAPAGGWRARVAEKGVATVPPPPAPERNRAGGERPGERPAANGGRPNPFGGNRNRNQ